MQVEVRSLWQNAGEDWMQMSVGGRGSMSQTPYNCHPCVIYCLYTHSCLTKQNHWFSKSIIKTFFSSKRRKTHHWNHVPRESSHHQPQLFHFHNTPPQKYSPFYSALIHHQGPAKWKIYVATAHYTLCHVFRGISPSVPCHCHRLLWWLSESDIASSLSKEPHVNLMTGQGTLSESSRCCAPTETPVIQRSPPWAQTCHHVSETSDSQHLL